VRIATFNINGVTRRLPLLLRWLDEAAPDIVCLQELKTAHELFPRRDIEKAGYHAVWQGQKTWNGVAILSRGGDPVITRTSLPGDPDDAQARYIEAAIDGVLIGNLYLPNGNPQPGPKFDYKLAWFDRLNRHARKLFASRQPVVLAGDYNVVPTDADIYAVRSYKDDALLQPEPRAAYRRLLAQGWTDSIRKIHPTAPIYTFWDYMRNRWPRDAGLRIDHLLLSDELSRRLAEAGVDRHVRGWEGASDHAPAWIVLDAGEKRKPTRKKASPPSPPAKRRKARREG
jgi:exodeoxyribonuclease-3